MAGFAPHFTRCIQNGSLELIEETEYTLSYAVQAAAMRVPFLPMLGVIDQTDIASVRKDLKKFPCPLTGADLYAVPALSLDVAIIHTSAADQFGNCNFQGQLGIDTYLPMVADLTIVTTERIVSTDELIAMPGAVQIPGLTVTHVVKAPGGSLPTSCLPSVSLDMEALLDYADAARDEGAPHRRRRRRRSVATLRPDRRHRTCRRHHDVRDPLPDGRGRGEVQGEVIPHSLHKPHLARA